MKLALIKNHFWSILIEAKLYTKNKNEILESKHAWTHFENELETTKITIYVDETFKAIADSKVLKLKNIFEAY